MNLTVRFAMVCAFALWLTSPGFVQARVVNQKSASSQVILRAGIDTPGATQDLCKDPQPLLTQAQGSPDVQALILASYKRPLRSFTDHLEGRVDHLLKTLENYGVQVSEGSFEQLRTDLKAVRIRALPPQAVVQGVGNGRLRKEAVHSHRCIVITEFLLLDPSTSSQLDVSQTIGKGTAYTISALLLHEALGAAGYDDHNFQFTSLALSLIMSGQEWNPALLKNRMTLRKSNVSSGEPLRLAQGGATVVGGGGDTALLLLKSLLLSQLVDPGLEQRGIARIPRDMKERFAEFIVEAKIDHFSNVEDLENTFLVGGHTQRILRRAAKVVRAQKSRDDHIYMSLPMFNSMQNLFSYLKYNRTDLEEEFTNELTPHTMEVMVKISQSISLPERWDVSPEYMEAAITQVVLLLMWQQNELRDLIKNRSEQDTFEVFTDLMLHDLYGDYLLLLEYRNRGRSR